MASAHSSLAPGIVSPRRSVPTSITRPEYVDRPAPAPYRGSEVQSPETIAAMRQAGRLAAQALQLCGEAVAPGVTTDELDRIGHEFLLDHGAYPSTLGYRGFPKSVCSSVNEVICHGIPDDRPLQDGDIVNIDITAYKNGVHGDTSAMFTAGDVSEEHQLLVDRTYTAMWRGIKAVKPGREVSIIGRVIEAYAKRFGYNVVRDFTGHGVGPTFHNGLIVVHHDEEAYNTVLEPGMTLTIEPMFNLGSLDYTIWEDDWTVQNTDHRWTAQWEHTMVVTEDGVDVLTLREGEKDQTKK